MTTPAYTAQTAESQGLVTIHLADLEHAIDVAVAPSLGNMAYEIRSRGENLLWFPFETLPQFQEKPALCGIPLLAPWANRLDGDAYWANGRRYRLNPELGNLRRDVNQKPIHGLLNFSALWQVVSTGADENGAWSTSRLEFFRHSPLMAQFPFAHTVTMTHRIAGGIVEVETIIENHSLEPMPVAVGYHPYFRLPGVPRDEWRVHLAARDHLTLNEFLIPTGEHRPVEFADPHPLSEGPLDDVFTNLVRDEDGRARFWVQGGGRRIAVTYGPKYQVAVVYAPAGKDFICFEPMAAVTNAFNLAQAGDYKELQSIPSGARWQESFWIDAR